MGAACSSENNTKTRDPPKTAASSQPNVIAQRFERIRDKFETVDEVQQALRQAGLESSDLILAIDLTKSNEWSGKHSFNGQCLHATTGGMNPYSSVINIVAKTLRAFDDDQLIPTFGFGDLQSKDRALVSFDRNCQPIHALENVLSAYNSQIGSVQLSGPTSFAPAIYKAIEIVRESHGQYHILVIIADGQVSPGACMGSTVQAIVEASNYPLSIVMVGVGDGPFDQMEEFDDALTQRLFDNFQFVNFTELGKRAAAQGFTAEKWEADFALSALMEIPDQYAIISKLGLLGKQHFNRQARKVEVFPLAAGHGSLHSSGSYPRV